MHPFYPNLELEIATWFAPFVLILAFLTLVNDDYFAHNQESLTLGQKGSDSYITAFLSLITSGVVLAYSVLEGYSLACCAIHWLGIVIIVAVIAVPLIVAFQCFMSALRVVNPLRA